jgi:hypothetical protein
MEEINELIEQRIETQDGGRAEPFRRFLPKTAFLPRFQSVSKAWRRSFPVPLPAELLR